MAPALVEAALRTPGAALERDVRQDMETRLGRHLGNDRVRSPQVVRGQALTVGPPVDESERQAHAVAAAVVSEAAGTGADGYADARAHSFDFRDVRVHRGPLASASAGAVNAVAYTVGRDIVFGQDVYRPRSARGRQVLAHELTHVVQQRGADARRTVQRQEPEGTGSKILRGAVEGTAGPLGKAVSDYLCLSPLEPEMKYRTFRQFLPRYHRDIGRPVPNRVWDAFGHCWVACAGTKKCGVEATWRAGTARELAREAQRLLGVRPHDSLKQDLNNQRHGRDLALSRRHVNCFAACNRAVPTGLLDLSAPEGTCYDGSTEYPAPCEPGGPARGSPAPTRPRGPQPTKWTP